MRVQAFSPTGSLSIGNGEIGLTVDVTGLQTFVRECQPGLPLGLQSQWAWRTSPNPLNFELADTYNWYASGDRTSPYPEVTPGTDAADPERFQAAAAWLRENPHRLQLAFIGLCRVQDGEPAALSAADITDIDQTLDLWTGRITSRFSIGGARFRVETAVHPDQDAVGFRIRQLAGSDGAWAVRLDFPAPSTHWRDGWTEESSDAHATTVERAAGFDSFGRRFETDSHFVAVAASSGEARPLDQHRFLYLPESSELDLVAAFTPSPPTSSPPSFDALSAASAEHWGAFWRSGMAVELEADDPRARELERRVVLSQFLTAAHGAGSQPPQESGLVTNSWHGKFHLEMHLWHAAHFALWGRPELLARSMGWYERILPRARATAQAQGFAGARWPKMVGPDGREAPSDIGVFLVWQQPHPVTLAELLYRAEPSLAVLERYDDLVAETARFMADFLLRRPDGSYTFRPPLIPAQETYRDQRHEGLAPTFELCQWRWALSVSQSWRERLDRPRLPAVDAIIAGLVPPTVVDGAYGAIATPPYTVRADHPSMLGALGLLPPTLGVDPDVMSVTLDRVLADWDWESTWGWDYPLIAMTAARLGRSEDAVAALLKDTPRNRFLASGHNYLGPPLPSYLPANGGLLYAVALMARGWNGSGQEPAPGFPTDWVVRVEGGNRAP